TRMSTSLSDFTSGVVKLDADGSNWMMFQSHFTIAVEYRDVLRQFDGTNPKPILSSGEKDTAPTKEQTDAYEKALAEWTKKEKLAKYMLSQKLPDTIWSDCMHKTSVAEMWKDIVIKYSLKSELSQAHLHSEFMAMRYTKGTDLRAEFD
ncbi:hypothetical protein M378DRAFT_89584, partial [Amanita muscaria Koide BX008]